MIIYSISTIKSVKVSRETISLRLHYKKTIK